MSAETPPPFDLPPLPEGLVCPACDYDLRGLTSLRCPECGLSLAGVREGRSLLPWAQPIGDRDTGWKRAPWRWVLRYGAFWRTVGMVTLHLPTLGNEVIRPVDDDAARRFRLLAVVHLWLPFLLLALILAVRRWNWLREQTGVYTWPLVIGAAAGLLAGLVAASDVAAWLLRNPRVSPERRRRAATLARYVAGLGAWNSVAIVLVAVWWAIGQRVALEHLPIAVLWLLLLGLVAWLTLLGLARRTLRVGLMRFVALGVIAPLLAGGALALVSLAVLGAVFYATIMVRGLAGLD